MRRILSVFLENEAGALSRVVGLFAQRNYNIESRQLLRQRIQPLTFDTDDPW